VEPCFSGDSVTKGASVFVKSVGFVVFSTGLLNGCSVLFSPDAGVCSFANSSSETSSSLFIRESSCLYSPCV